MKIQLTSFFVLLLSVQVFAQIKFDAGYIINKENQKKECLIKNYDWKNNPSTFEYKFDETDGIHFGTTKDINAFCVYNGSKYVRAEVRIDLSSSDLNNLTTTSSPQWNNDTLFLKVLIEGKASLYSYESKSLLRFFYSIDKTEFQQLIYKEYLKDNSEILKNNGYRQQLWNDVRISNSSDSFNNMMFTKTQLTKYFNKFNQLNPIAQNKENLPVTSIEKTTKNLLSFKIKPGICPSSLQLSNVYGTVVLNYIFPKSYRLGMDVEYTIPYWRNKWCITVEPSIEYLSTPVKEYYREVEDKLYSFSVDYQTINIPIGIRYYLFLNEKSKLFFNGYIVYDLKTKFSLNDKLTNDDKNLYYNFGIGGGYEYRSLSVELRYYTQNQIYNNNFWFARYNRLFLNIGYRFLDIKNKK
jgi:hypothetical protein